MSTLESATDVLVAAGDAPLIQSTWTGSTIHMVCVVCGWEASVTQPGPLTSDACRRLYRDHARIADGHTHQPTASRVSDALWDRLLQWQEVLG